MKSRIVVPASLLFTYLFFFEYLRPFKWVHIPYDLNVYHYSLADYIFRALRAGRFPTWDPTQFCGIGLASNIQAELFYPPMWLLFAANWGRQHLSYSSLEIFQIAHVWLAFYLCYRWLRKRELSYVAALIGAGAYAFGGYVGLNLQHLGLIVAYAWFPLGFEGIDEALRTRTWKPFLKLVTASAMAFLAGYPPTWLAFAVFAGTYAVLTFDLRVAIGTLMAFVASLAVAAIQLLPTREAAAAKIPELRYGAGIRDLSYFISLLIPNYYNFGLNVPIQENPGKDCLYLGAAAILGIALLWRVRKWKPLIPLAGAGLVGLVVITNPYNLVWTAIEHSPLLADLVRSGYFLVIVPMTVAPLAAYGIDAFLKRKARPVQDWVSGAIVAVAVFFCGLQIERWATNRLPAGIQSLYDVLIAAILLGAVLFGSRSQTGVRKSILIATALLIAAVDYKAFVTSKRFDAGLGDGAVDFVSSQFPGMSDDDFNVLRAHPEFRILRDDPGGPHPLELREGDLNTIQGFDPLFTTAYRTTLLDIAHADFTERDRFTIDPSNEVALRLYGVRYAITAEAGKSYAQLMSSPDFRPVGKFDSYYRVFEYVHAEPPFGWESKSEEVKLTSWQPERRVFDVRSDSGGRFTLREQFLPGWEATIDGRSVPIERWTTAFQAVIVPGGAHQVLFRYRPRSLRYGAWISGISILLLALSVTFRPLRGPNR